jgi:hypothetical protein
MLDSPSLTTPGRGRPDFLGFLCCTRPNCNHRELPVDIRLIQPSASRCATTRHYWHDGYVTIGWHAPHPPLCMRIINKWENTHLVHLYWPQQFGKLYQSFERSIGNIATECDMMQPREHWATPVCDGRYKPRSLVITITTEYAIAHRAEFVCSQAHRSVQWA